MVVLDESQEKLSNRKKKSLCIADWPAMEFIENKTEPKLAYVTKFIYGSPPHCFG